MGKIKRISDIVELQLSSAGRMTSDPFGNGSIQDPNRLEKFDSDIRTLKSVIASANDKIHLIGESVKSFNDSLTELGKSFIVTKDTAKYAVGAVNSVSTAGLNGGDLLSGTSAGGLYETTMNVRGARAKEILRQKVAEVGGRVAFSHDKATIQFPILDSTYQQYLQEQQNYVRGVSNPLARFSPETRVKHEFFDEAMRESNKEARLIRRIEKEKALARVLAEQERQAKALEAYNAKRLDTDTYAGEKLKERLGGDSSLMGLSQKEINQRIKAYDKEETKKREEEKDRKRIEAEQKKEEKEKQESRRQVKTKIGVIIASVLAVANIARRLLTAVLDLGRERREAGLEARALGLPASTLVEAGYVESARGMKKGTIAGALSALQQKFGDPRALDESALRELAPYIPQAIAPAVRSGLYGGANSEKLLEIIVDNAVARIGKGLNWAGEQVGEKEARRNILSSLERVSPELAQIVNNMYDTNRFGIYAGSAGTYQDWFNTGFGKQNPAILANTENITQLSNVLGGRFSSEWDMFKTSVLDKLSGILGWLENSGIGLSDEEKATKKVEDYAQALKVEQELSTESKSLMNMLSSSLSSKGIDFSTGKYKYGNKTISSVEDLTPYTLQGLLANYVDIGEAFQDPEVIAQYARLMVLQGQYTSIGKELDKVRKEGKLSDFNFNRVKYTPEYRALASGDVSGKLIPGGFNPYDIPRSLSYRYTPDTGVTGVTYNEAFDYMQGLESEYGVSLGYESLSPLTALNFLKKEYEWALDMPSGSTEREERIRKIRNVLRALYGKDIKGTANWGAIYRDVEKRVKSGDISQQALNAVISAEGLKSLFTAETYSEGTNIMPENIMNLGAKAVAQKKSETEQQNYLLLQSVLKDPVVASYINGKNGTLNKGTITAKDEYTLDVNLNVTSNGKTETKTFRIKSNSTGVKQGATFDIANAKAQGSSY